jgi:hypothetical protein
LVDRNLVLGKAGVRTPARADYAGLEHVLRHVRFCCKPLKNKGLRAVLRKSAKPVFSIRNPLLYPAELWARFGQFTSSFGLVVWPRRLASAFGFGVWLWRLALA